MSVCLNSALNNQTHTDITSVTLKQSLTRYMFNLTGLSPRILRSTSVILFVVILVNFFYSIFD